MQTATVTLVVVMDGEYIVERAAYTSHENAVKALAAYCRECWEEEGHDGSSDYDDGPLSDDDQTAIREYFDYWSEEKKYEMGEINLDAEM